MVIFGVCISTGARGFGTIANIVDFSYLYQSRPLFGYFGMFLDRSHFVPLKYHKVCISVSVSRVLVVLAQLQILQTFVI